ncbi:DUF1796 family putative cysteine peptidase [Alicyclobacillus suci]|uniref:DUF1796 family putative cysteine peptidase n=1 Tax=Alicyclobacillus suci TaxID=2816080 RepID=UPI001A8DB72F|nr:DUF1796 family putative cysteine peptidase [Alicyclobacillus suci]
MQLREIKRPYDLIVSLGSACAPAAHLRRHNLRKFSMPFDWVVSQSLSDINRVLENKFEDYMELDNMERIDGVAHLVENGVIKPVKTFFIKDNRYHIISVHDFPVTKHWVEHYPQYKEKLNDRVNRFLEQLAASKSVLFVRWAADRDEVLELKRVLSELVKGDIRILIINPRVELEAPIEGEWGIPGVCLVYTGVNSEDVKTWDTILNGITLRNTVNIL